MNRVDLVNFICDKSGLVEDSDRLAAQSFLSKRYELIFNQFLWKDSLVAYDLTVSPTDANNAEGIVLVPDMIDRVVALRTPLNAIRIHGQEEYYRIDYDKFSRLGQPYEFTLLSPVWFIWRGEIGLKIVNASADDDNKTVKITWKDTSGIRHVDIVTLNSGNPPLLQDNPTTNTVIVSGTANNLSSGVDGVYTWNGSAFSDGDLNRIQYDVASSHWQLITDSSHAFYSPTGVTGPWFPDTDPDLYSTPTVARGVVTKIEIESIFKNSTTGTVSISPQLVGEDAGGTLGVSTTRSPSNQRIRLYSIPSVQMTLSILGKQKFVPLDFDQEVPMIKNLDNTLIAFGMADMLVRARQYAKAQQQQQEGAILLKELAQIEVLQAANNSQFVPEGGFGEGYFSPTYGLGNLFY